MITDNLKNSCSYSNKNSLDKRIDALEKTNSDEEKYFSSQHIYTPKLDADVANTAKVNAGSVETDNIVGGAGTLDSLTVSGTVTAKKFNVEEPLIVDSITTDRVDANLVDTTKLCADNATIGNLTVDNIITSPESSLEYKNISVTNNATINNLNLIDPHISEVNTDSSNIIDLTTQNVVMSAGGKLTRDDNNQNVIRYIDGTTVLGDLDNSINIDTKERPRWNDNILATVADIQQGAIKPVYKGIIDTYDELPQVGNTKGDLYVIRQLTISDQTGIGHAQFNGISWDAVLIYELDSFVNRLFDQDIDGRKRFLKQIRGTIDNSMALNGHPDSYFANAEEDQDIFGNKTFKGNVTIEGDTSAKSISVTGNISSKDIDTNLVTASGVSTDDIYGNNGDLYIQRGENRKVHFGNNGTYTISEDGSEYSGNAATAYGKTFDQLKAEILNLAHPVGSYYWSSKPDNPKTLFGGEWTQVEDKFVMAKGSLFPEDGGHANGTITLTLEQLPSHSHGKGSLVVNTGGSHTHAINDPGHTHETGGSHKITDTGYAVNFLDYGRSGIRSKSAKTNIKILSDGSSHSHTISGSTSSTGSGSSINVMPPYEVAYCWKRTK